MHTMMMQLQWRAAGGGIVVVVIAILAALALRLNGAAAQASPCSYLVLDGGGLPQRALFPPPVAEGPPRGAGVGRRGIACVLGDGAAGGAWNWGESMRGLFHGWGGGLISLSRRWRWWLRESDRDEGLT
jgi:hypothetical protein